LPVSYARAPLLSRGVPALLCDPIAHQNKGWAELEAKTQTAQSELGGRERHLDAQEIAVAEREQAASELAQLMDKVNKSG
jgi:hypothetical protein